MLQQLINLLSVQLDRFPVLDRVAERSSDSAAVLAKGAEDVEVGLGGALAEGFHLVGEGVSPVVGGFDEVVGWVEEFACREDDQTQVIIDDVADGELAEDDHVFEQKGLEQSADVDEGLGFLGLERHDKVLLASISK